MNYMIVITAVTAFALSLLLIPYFRLVAMRMQLVDKPNARKVHKNSVPLIGGIAVFISALLALTLSLTMGQDVWLYKNILAGSTILLIMGIIDDKMDLRASLKLAIQLLIAHYIYAQGIRIESLIGFMGIYEIPELAQYGLTILVITGVVNAFNLMDGIDGLAAGLAIVSLITFTVLAYLVEATGLMYIFMALIGALVGFLRFNFSKTKKVFMGDAGSLVLGFILVVSGIMLIQLAGNTPSASTIEIGVVAVLILPVLDSLRVYRKRIKAGKSPFKADKTHFHHMVLQLNIKHVYATVFIVAVAIATIGLGIWTSSAIGITLALSGLLIFFVVISSVLQLNSNIHNWKARIKGMEMKDQPKN
ncbi:MAG: undecaprenyl/decaprenyl-phosphate alpha-N-acetylglucosaminyl 1-phosphate transferase [Cryomorphaceae bacterium]|nr:undecaprenyl/decaprenyl-phosphate alpha-N-acetylglucosaminyl 1-phosphate transferase [Cryomorphaceae bacterium]